MLPVYTQNMLYSTSDACCWWKNSRQSELGGAAPPVCSLLLLLLLLLLLQMYPPWNCACPGKIIIPERQFKPHAIAKVYVASVGQNVQHAWRVVVC